MSSNISADAMVQELKIESNFDQSFPGSNLCKITFTDGRKVTTHLGLDDLHHLIQAIAKEKISYEPDPRELEWPPQTSDDFSCTQWIKSDKKCSTAEEILAKI